MIALARLAVQQTWGLARLVVAEAREALRAELAK